MPAKYRRSRRKISQSGKSNNITNNIPANIEPNANSFPIKTAGQSGEKSSIATEANLGKYVISEIKWIGVVTGIILVLLVISYVIFR